MSSKANGEGSHGKSLDPAMLKECKAAYISVMGNVKADIISKEDFITALQNTGRNPTKKAVSKYWSKSTDSLSFDDFCHVCQKEKVTSEDDLMKAFKKIDVNGDGFLSHSELKKVMTSKGEKMSDEEVQDLIDEVDENRDGKLDYKEFCNMILSTSKKCKSLAMEKMEKMTPKGARPPSGRSNRDSPRTPVPSKKTGSSEDEDLSSRSSRDVSAPKLQPIIDTKDSSVASDRVHDEEDIFATASTNTARRRRAPIGSKRSPLAADTANHGSVSSTNEKAAAIVAPASSLSVATPLSTSSNSKSVKPSDTGRDPYDDDDDVVVSSSQKQHNVKPVPRSRGSSKQAASESSPKPTSRSRANELGPFPAISSANLKLSTPKNLAKWSKHSVRGLFMLEEADNIITYHYLLKVTRPSSLWITVTPTPSQSTVLSKSGTCDTRLLVLRDKVTKEGHSLLTFTENRDSKGKYFTRVDLDPGSYRLVPFTSGARLKERAQTPAEEAKLVRKDKEGNYTITKAFRDALTEIFYMCDVDGNGKLSREEFSLYNLRTSDEELGDDEWEVVQDTVELDGGELTLEGFIKLNEMEVEEWDGDSTDLWVTLSSFGFNKALSQDEAYPFALEVCLEADPKSKLSLQSEFVSLTAPDIQDAMKDIVLNKGNGLELGANGDVSLVSYVSDGTVVCAVQNQSKFRKTLDLDFSSSTNVKMTMTKPHDTYTVPAQSCKVIGFFLPKDERKEWNVSFTDKDGK